MFRFSKMFPFSIHFELAGDQHVQNQYTHTGSHHDDIIVLKKAPHPG